MPFDSAVVIRPASIADARSIAAVQVETWQSAYRGVISDDFLNAFSVAERERRWAEILRQPEQIVFVAEAEDRQVVGFASGGPERTGRTDFRGELYGLYVLPACHGRGHGKALVAAVARRLLELQHANLLVWTLSDNPFRGFYEHLGGQLVTERQITIGHQTLNEVAYGWADLAPLADSTRKQWGDSGKSAGGPVHS